ncbi:hypothetical protein CCHL11_03618 [Colletotrichum chlorophyti]|uniref:Biogenesis of lysosome-related organelles complex 1 subunit 1 n=1 Tax=Colletotrichum chlorophyti TaxID=708187 RepID=A0A1Q8RS84_9PEZI|nr:hypothetical protein CCHL11_03618 [Colletotrichum chlorophyti]
MFTAQPSTSSSSSARNTPPSVTSTTTSQHPSVSSAARPQQPLSSNTSMSAPAPQAQQQIHQTLPREDQQRHVAEARQAVVASIGNMLDGELQSRARMLHANAAALDAQERDVARATEALRKENDKLARFAGDAARRVKELGNVQNWAEVLERDFLVLEETFRLVREGSEGTGSWSGSRSWSESGSEVGDRDGDVRMEGGSDGMDKGKKVGAGDVAGVTEVDRVHEDCSEASQTEAKSNGAEGRAKGSDTTSISTLQSAT